MALNPETLLSFFKKSDNDQVDVRTAKLVTGILKCVKMHKATIRQLSKAERRAIVAVVEDAIEVITDEMEVD